MDLKEFRQLSAKEQADKVNLRLSELEQEGLNTTKFKCEELNFSYSTAVNQLSSVGYERHGKGPFLKTLSNEEIEVLQMLASKYEYLSRLRYNLGACIEEHPVEDIKTTTFRVDVNVLKEWQEFCKQHPAFSANELLNAALKDFMQLH